MKKSLMLVVLIFLSCTQAGWAADEDPAPLISTTASARMSVDNDSVRVSLAVVSENKNLQTAATENAQLTQKIIDGLKALGLSALKLQTAGYRVMPMRDYTAKKSQIIGYTVHNTLEAELEGFEKAKLSSALSKVLETAMAQGANEILALEFYVKNRQAFEDEVLAQAVKRALAKVNVLAQASGLRVKKIKEILTDPSGNPPRYAAKRMAAPMMEAAAAPPIESGESEITANISLTVEAK